MGLAQRAQGSAPHVGERRAAYAAIGVLAAALAAGLRSEALPLGAGRVRDLGLAGSESAASVGHALVQALLQTPELLVAAAALGAAAAALPYARKRGPWGIAGLGAGMIALTLLGAPAAPALPFVLVTWGLCIGLAVKDAR